MTEAPFGNTSSLDESHPITLGYGQALVLYESREVSYMNFCHPHRLVPMLFLAFPLLLTASELPPSVPEYNGENTRGDAPPKYFFEERAPNGLRPMGQIRMGRFSLTPHLDARPSFSYSLRENFLISIRSSREGVMLRFTLRY